MKSISPFFRTTLIGGLLFLVPIIVVVAVFGKALALTHKLMDPLAEHIPVESIVGLRTPMLLAIVVIVLFCFLAGLFARTALAQQFVGGLEEAVLSKIPGYEMLKSTGESILGVEDEEGHPVVLMRLDDAWQIGFRIEELQNGLVAVYIPGAPDARSGSVLFVTPDRVIPAGVSAAPTLKCLRGLGVGARELLGGVSLSDGSASSGSPKG
jgi:uncharacterized membrane protein